MHAVLTATNHRAMKLETPFERFLHGRAMLNKAKRQFCEPEELILDHLPQFEAGSEEELAEAFAEACEQATGGSLSKVAMNKSDLAFARRHFLESRRFRFVMPMPLEAA